jgi:folate-binding protein YgfZ
LAYHGDLATHKILILAPVADNHSPAKQTFFAVPDYAAVALEGVDATAFAHAQFANDVTGLAPGHWHWNAWLTPKGRVIAVFALLKLAEDRLLLILLDHPADEFATQLRRFVFRRKLKIETLPDWHVSGALIEPEIASGAQIAQKDDGIELDFSGHGGARCLRIAASSTAPEPSSTQEWAAYDLRHGLPRLSAAQREQWTPQQLSLDRLQAYSVKKGCYPGQEIVARTHFLGKAKRGLALFEADTTVLPGAPVSDGSRDIGEIVSALPGDTPLALAVLPLDRPPGALNAGAIPLQEVALQGGLAR